MAALVQLLLRLLPDIVSAAVTALIGVIFRRKDDCQVPKDAPK